MPDMIATAKFRYSKKKYRPGDIVPAKDDNHAKILVQAGWAKEIVEQPAYQTRHMEAVRVTARTVPELRAECAARGIPVGHGYVPKAELLRLLSEER
jgi:hypothetical protein